MLVTIKKKVLQKILYLLQRFFLCFDYEVKKISKLAWPQSDISCIEQKFLLLLSVNNAGTTAMAKFICQSQKIHGLMDHCEGAPLLPVLIHKQDNPNKYVNYHSVAGVWSAKIDQLKQLHPEMEYVFEKSHTHIFRYKNLLKIIPNTTMVASNRNPYAKVASSMRRRDLLDDKDEQCKMHIHDWLIRSQAIKDACEENNIPLVTYEQFCDNPSAMISAFGLEESEFRNDFQVSVKDYIAQPIKNMNKEQIALLSDTQKEIVSNALSSHEALLAYFGYELIA